VGAALNGSIGRGALLFAIASAFGIAVALDSGRGGLAQLAGFVLAIAFGSYCRHRIGGYTGDTLGASAEFSAALILVTLVAIH
jgi:cobalamin synthase